MEGLKLLLIDRPKSSGNKSYEGRPRLIQAVSCSGDLGPAWN